MKVINALVLMSLVSVSSVCASDEKNKKETQRFVEIIANLADGKGFLIILPHHKKDLIKDSSGNSGESKALTVNDFRQKTQASLSSKAPCKNRTGMRFVSGTPYTPVAPKLVSKL